MSGSAFWVLQRNRKGRLRGSDGVVCEYRRGTDDGTVVHGSALEQRGSGHRGEKHNGGIRIWDLEMRTFLFYVLGYLTYFSGTCLLPVQAKTIFFRYCPQHTHCSVGTTPISTTNLYGSSTNSNRTALGKNLTTTQASTFERTSNS